MRSIIFAPTLLALAAAQNPLTLAVAPDGSFSITGAISLASAPPGVMVGGAWQALAAAGAPTYFSGADAWGAFSGTAVSFKTATGVAMDAVFRAYNSTPAVTFTQTFPQEVATGGVDANSLVSAFPAFAIPATPSAFGTVQWLGAFVNNGVGGPQFSTWGPQLQVARGLEGGPILFYDASATNAVVLGPAAAFMSASLVADRPGVLSAGIEGAADPIPAGWSQTFVLYAGAGPNAAVMGYGAGLLAKYGKPAGLSKNDYTNNYLGYNTDHGAYYYCEPGCLTTSQPPSEQ